MLAKVISSKFFFCMPPPHRDAGDIMFLGCLYFFSRYQYFFPPEDEKSDKPSDYPPTITIKSREVCIEGS